ncbi:MAG: restriction endonuclease [Solibacillus sp.]
MTNNYFTQSAITLAKENHVRLINRDEFISWMLEVNG